MVRIRDTGIGIAPDVLPRVFDMFQQAEPSLERSSGGLGIGLTLARRLVEMHDGRIAIRSAGPGLGTEVEIRLPIIAVPHVRSCRGRGTATGCETGTSRPDRRGQSGCRRDARHGGVGSGPRDQDRA